MLALAIVTLASFLAATILTPLVRRLAIRWDIVDKPDGVRKLHGRIIARAGGTAVLASVLLVSALASLRLDLANIEFSEYIPFISLLSVMIGIWLLGLADDIWTLRGRQKLVGQFILAGILAFSGFRIGSLQVLGMHVDLGLLSIPISIVWLLATTNALNLIDGADGLCSTLGAVICGSLGVLAYVNGHDAEATIAFSFCGALLGFLVFNFPPATIFLGDSGSLLIGMVTGALAIRCALKGPASVAFLGPLAILALPLLDSCMAIVRRKLTGRSIYTTDRAHLHHTLRNKGLGDRGLLLTVAILASLTATGALLGQALGRDWIAPIAVAVVFGMLVVTKAFGYAEVSLVARRSTRFAQSLLQPVRRPNDSGHHQTVHLQGTRQWKTVWQTLVEFAEDEYLSKLHMDLNVPWLEEGFHGTWHRGKMPEKISRWSTSVPIYADGRLAGRLDVVGPSDSAEALGAIGKLIELVEDLVPQIELIIDASAADTPITAATSPTGEVLADESVELPHSEPPHATTAST